MGIKFPFPWKTLVIKFPPPRDGKAVKCPGSAPWGGGGMLKLRFDRYITDTGTDFILVNANVCNQEASLVCEAHI